MPRTQPRVTNGLVADAAEAVQKAGYKSASGNFRLMVNIALTKKKFFKRVERGCYTAK